MVSIKKREDDSKQCTSPAFFNKIPLFANLTAEDIALFSDATRVKSYKKGQLVYSENEHADFFFVMCTGWVKLFHTTEEGEEVILAMLPKNGIMGENAIFNQRRYTSSAQVVEDSHILTMPISLLQEKLRVNNQLLYNMVDYMAQDQRRHEQQLEQFLLYSAPQRIGCFLLGLCPELDRKDGVVINLPYDKTLIASTLGMKGATFSRALNILREETGLHIAGTRVTLDSMARLLKFVDGCYLATQLPQVRLDKQ